MKIIDEYRREKAAGNKLRPWYQITYLLPLYPVYLLADKFVNWMDER